MSAAHIYTIKMLLKALGLNAERLEEKLQDAQKVVLEFDLDELRGALQMIIDLRTRLDDNELRTIALLNHFNVIDPVLMASIELKGKENDNAEDQ